MCSTKCSISSLLSTSLPTTPFPLSPSLYTSTSHDTNILSSLPSVPTILIIITLLSLPSSLSFLAPCLKHIMQASSSCTHTHTHPVKAMNAACP